MLMNLVSIVLIISSVSTSIYCIQKNYDNYKVFRIIPNTSVQLKILREFANVQGYSFWIEPNGSNPVDVQVAPTHLNEFIRITTEAGMAPKIVIDNMQNLINDEKSTFESRAGDDTFNFHNYHKLEKIYIWMDNLPLTHPQIVHKIIGGETFQGRVIQGVLLQFSTTPKPGIFIEGGMHAREWISPATVVYLIDRLLNSQDSNLRQLAGAYDWYIFPVCNPDGYVYTHSTDRMWQKTLSDTGMGPEPANTNCKGVDLNRNFEYMWQEQEQPDTNPCSERYPGPRAFSDVESRSLSEYIKTLRGKLFAYISVHSYSQFILLPYDHTPRHLQNYHDALVIGSEAIANLNHKFSTPYRIGNRAELAGAPVTGTAMDWVKNFMNLDLVFTFKMRDKNNYGYLLPQRYIVRNGEEFIESLISMFQKARSLGYPKCLNSGEGSSSGIPRCGKLPRCFGG